MRFLFSESNPDYNNYTFPYVVWAIPESTEDIQDLYNRGFLPSKAPYYYLTRSTRLSLHNFRTTYRLRRTLKTGRHIKMHLTSSTQFTLSAAIKSMCLDCATCRFGEGIVSEERLIRIFSPANTTHIMQFTLNDKIIDLVTTNLINTIAHYNFAFYDITLTKLSPGIFMLTTAAEHFKKNNYTHLYMGTCYSQHFLYKARLEGFEFFNGACWSGNTLELDFLIHRTAKTGHLFECPDYIRKFSIAPYPDH
jgi:hypothetical protein